MVRQPSPGRKCTAGHTSVLVLTPGNTHPRPQRALLLDHTFFRFMHAGNWLACDRQACTTQPTRLVTNACRGLSRHAHFRRVCGIRLHQQQQLPRSVPLSLLSRIATTCCHSQPPCRHVATVSSSVAAAQAALPLLRFATSPATSEAAAIALLLPPPTRRWQRVRQKVSCTQ